MEQTLKDMQDKLEESDKQNEGFHNLFRGGLLSLDDDGDVRVVEDKQEQEQIRQSLVQLDQSAPQLNLNEKVGIASKKKGKGSSVFNQEESSLGG